jgi:Kef-type K+ transport system membrane component KefB
VATNLIGISAVFGALLFGAALSDRPGLREAVSARLKDVVTTLLLPVFFTATGLRTDVGTLGGLWWVAGVVFAAAAGGKLIGCTLAARFTGFAWKEAVAVGALMNTRGLIALVVINIGYDMGVVPKSLFACLVLMAVATTLLAGPLVLLVRKGTELEGAIRASGFVRERSTRSPEANRRRANSA